MSARQVLHLVYSLLIENASQEDREKLDASLNGPTLQSKDEALATLAAIGALG